MARITCAISGIRFSTSHLESLSIPATAGYYHPVFALTYSQLHSLYTDHCKGKLTPPDSYLLFLAFLNSSDKIDWQHPVTLNPNDSSTKQLIQNNIAQLISVLERTGLIAHPSFKQPNFRVSAEGSYLVQIPNWIEAWQDNIANFQQGRIDSKLRDDLQAVENRLSKLILSGDKPERFSHVIAQWANQAAEFPAAKAELYERTIRSCFNITKMFNTPLPLLKEIKDYCECNIDVGSIHFHTLSNVLKEGIKRHVDYLGGSSLALGYTLLESPVSQQVTLAARQVEDKNNKQLLEIAATASTSPPVESDYTTSVEFLRAKLAYRVAKTISKAPPVAAPIDIATPETKREELLDSLLAPTSCLPADNSNDIEGL
jgi:hypothetical protein